MRTAEVRGLSPTKVLEKIGSVWVTLERIDAELKLHHYRIRNFEPNLSFSFERGHYTIKTAENGVELEECLKLRFEVFHREYMQKKRTVGVDIDKLDYACDHLIIRDNRTGRIIGTYRLNSSRFTDTYYSTGEFEICDVLRIPGHKLELGRACIDREHRNGSVITLLWRGMMEYVARTDTKTLFGCTSIKTMEPLEIGRISKYLSEKGQVEHRLDVVPTKKFKVKQFDRMMEYLEANPFEYRTEDVDDVLPTLLKVYLKAGAKVCAEPAIDREFGCVDFLTILRIDEMTTAMADKFKK